MDPPDTSASVRRPRKPVKVLSTKKKIDRDLEVIAARNKRESRLLRLPAELRNRIWRYVLGDRVIHIEDVTNIDAADIFNVNNIYAAESPKHYFCNAAESPRDFAERHIKAGSEVGAELEWHNMHTNCAVAKNHPHDPVSDSLVLLAVCRQIHAEAALLPFTSNEFLCETPSALTWLAKKLFHEQRQAVTKVCIVKSRADNFRFGGNHGMTEGSLLRKMAGLQHLTILGNLQRRRPHFSLYQPEYVHTQLTQAVSQLRYVKWKSIVACILVEQEAYQTIRQVVPNFDACRADCREVENTLKEDATEAIAEIEARRAEGVRNWKKSVRQARKQKEIDRRHIRKMRKEAYDEQMRDRVARYGKKASRK